MTNDQIQPGELRDRITLQAPVPETEPNYGQTKEGFATQDDVWCKLEPVSGRDVWYTGQPGHLATWKITLRWYPGLAPSWRGIANGRVLNFEHVAPPVGNSDKTVIFAIEQVQG